MTEEGNTPKYFNNVFICIYINIYIQQSKAVNTYVAKTFFQLINRHLPKSHRLLKIFNKNTVKVSYSCMQNMSKIYKGHNNKITFTSSNQLTLCNRWVKEKYPVDGRCQTMDTVYDCHVTRTTKNLLWIGRKKMEEKVL